MHAALNLPTGGGLAIALAIALGGCGKMKQNEPREIGKLRAESKRQQEACASSSAYDRLKNLLFDQAIGARNGDRANLDTLADYSIARMEDPVVKDWNPALDVTRCEGRFILQFPPGAERAFGGERRLQADIEYTAQAAADGSGLVYQIKGAEPIAAKLAAFNLSSGAFQPPPAIDERQAGPEVSASTVIARADVPAPLPSAALTRSVPVPAPKPTPLARPQPSAPERIAERAAPAPKTAPVPPMSDDGEATVRAFYGALGAGNGAAAAGRIIPEKRASRAFSPKAMSRFYGGLPEPIRLTEVVALPGGAYRVSYRYSAGRSRCNGSAVVNLTNRGGREMIRSIRALNGC